MNYCSSFIILAMLIFSSSNTEEEEEQAISTYANVIGKNKMFLKWKLNSSMISFILIKKIYRGCEVQ